MVMNCTSKRIPEVHCKVAKKNQRDYMEDRHLVAKLELPGKGTIDLVAVFDGHAGDEVAEELIKIFPEMLADKMDKLSNIDAPLSVTDALNDTFLAVDYKLYQGGGFTSGSTGVVALWPPNNYLYIGNLGDSRAVVWSGDHLIVETKDHKPQHEQERIKASGGFIEQGRVGGIMAVSRSFGDFKKDLKLLGKRYMGTKAPLSAQPDIYRVDLRDYPDQVRMVLASDGLWDVYSTREVMEFFNAHDDNGCANIITKAIERGSLDNITVMVIDIPRCQKARMPSDPLAELLRDAENAHKGKDWANWYAGYLLQHGVRIDPIKDGTTFKTSAYRPLQ